MYFLSYDDAVFISTENSEVLTLFTVWFSQSCFGLMSKSYKSVFCFKDETNFAENDATTEVEEANDDQIKVDPVSSAPKITASQKSSTSSSGGAGKSWASLFHKDTPPDTAINPGASKPTARIQPYSNSAEEDTIPETEVHKRSQDEPPMSNPALSAKALNINPNDLDMAKFLQDYNLSHRSCMIKPRGLSNRNNWCFVNAILQALVACPPFYNMMKSLPLEAMRKSSMTKITKAVYDFIAELAPLDHFPKINRRDRGRRNEDLPLGLTFEASSIFQFLKNLKSDTFKVEEGRQEDAEEFLTFLLNELNDEMVGLLKLLVESDPDEGQEVTENEDEGDDSEWHEVGARNKSLLTRRVGSSNESLRSPLGSIFQGQLQSCVQSSIGEPTATLQPFFTLPLDIQSKNIKTISDAFHHNFTSETIDG